VTNGALWDQPIATGVGSLPGSDPREAVRTIIGELPDFPHVPELPERGPWAGMTGRSAALLVELPVDLQPAGWRLVDRPGTDLRRSQALLREDLDALEEFTDGYAGLLKLQVCGPFTLASTLEKMRGDKVLGDYAARHDLAQSLTEGVRAHVAEVVRRVPRAQVVLQVDEPAISAALAGEVPTISGFGRLRAVDELEVRRELSALATAVGVPTVVHCCAGQPPVDVLHADGVAGISFDLALLDLDDDTSLAPLAVVVESGGVLLAGIVPTTPADDGARLDGARIDRDRVDVAAGRRRIATLWHRLGQPADALASRVAVTPTCGLAGAAPSYAREAMAAARAIATALRSDPDVA
jgi:methionine synthase II (cobalamin-independent)